MYFSPHKLDCIPSGYSVSNFDMNNLFRPINYQCVFYNIVVLTVGLLALQVEMVYSLLSMLGTHDKDDMSRTLLAMSSSQDSCIAMRQSGCLPLLIQLLHGNDKV